MASILSQYEVYIRPHEPFLFSWRLLSSSVSLLGAHGSLANIIIRRIALYEIIN